MSDFFKYAREKSARIQGAKHIARFYEQLALLPRIPATFYAKDGIHIQALAADMVATHHDMLYDMAIQLKPWRKGPFFLFDIHIDSEWQSFMKWQLLAPHCNLKGKHIADVGCNNGYYMFEMLSHEPDSIIGFDPSGLFKAQFDFVNHFINAPINFELLGVEDLLAYTQAHKHKFDVIFCLGVLYHRLEPISTLKILSQSLQSGGEVILDTLIYQSEEEICLSPAKSYAKMSNVYFIPSISALKGWCERAKFSHFEILALSPTTTKEQRASKWVDSQSLAAFLNESQTLTIEGYQAPIRGYFKLRKD
ncbi:tRNA 5-methoxyuridine(34)/uridine 5-oxyacetic acid(34) synthase CmoB [Helicobacter jaachi]|uniref:tRNA 5-methoxyuridine(34)/uridine 5-oxyacetic acid(34) synthase CmoB n=1 Tax=Helicobacter jaachi TaxID=1677920 RepID=A0A4U8TCD0_9HELI|nr:tRNA 5-methoxyuridine(34)/uridine 5-oxyacetic acid(34) synthase CmoB [Helicobacter jaachi]TLD97463.1 tRNA 5-methoxyuridine(34)/uridine 5-oxyacetic acid(34) synthase CmoB [Helicobacter jaachi]